MWNNTRLLNLLANVMFAAASLIILKLAVIALLSSPRFPVRYVRFSGELARVAPDQLTDALTGRVMGNFFSVDLATVRQWVESVPWVRRATVRRAWPDRLEIHIEAHQALARWSDRELVNTYGELFTAETADKLPRFSGPAGTEKDVTDRYRRFCELLAPLQKQPSQVTLTPRFAWELRLSDGLLLELGGDGGRESADDRLMRFVRLYPSTLAKFGQRVDYVDLRYPNGFAVHVPDLPQFLKDSGDLPEDSPAPHERKMHKSAAADSAAQPA